ncbi:unnamed protein product [Symbiodinium natans]|uniref:Uncharacterized protein n=1 Tax=Symbiodinium natans TaxID=878477 RepID=A0A812QMA9_9DINO|nr:unnamed protein product [Symbiodinium natans]
MLVEFDESKGRALFVSHQWLSEAHPDPDSQQLKVLQDALTNLLSGHSRISTAVFTELLHGRVPVPSAADLKEQLLFVWYDFFSCPQGNSPDSTNNQRNAINSIPHYVAKSQYFIILTPAVRHHTLGHVLSQWTWAQRGWCLAERMARELTPSRGLVIVVEGATHLTLLPGITSILYSPGEGSFTLEEDREKVAGIAVQLVWSRMQHYLAEGDLHNYRFLLNQQVLRLKDLPVLPIEVHVPGMAVDVDPFEDPAAFMLARFMHLNGFSSVTEGDEAGWPPMCYAAINGNPSLVTSLLRLRADVNDRTRRPKPEAHLPRGIPALCLCACFRNNEAMQILLSARAELNAKDGYSQTALHWACLSNNAEAVRMLLIAGIDHTLLSSPAVTAFQVACAYGATEAIREILEHAPTQPLQYGLHFAFMMSQNSPELVSLLIKAKADINEQFYIRRSEKFGLWASICYGSLRHRVSSPTRFSTLAYHHHGATPMMCSIICGAFEITHLLLSAGARTDLRNGRGRVAADLAMEVQQGETVGDAA